MTFSKNLIALRTERGLTQAALGQALKFTPQAISKWENGLSEPDLRTVKQLADFFGVSVEALISDAPYASPETSAYTASEAYPARAAYDSGHPLSPFHADEDHGILEGSFLSSKNTGVFYEMEKKKVEAALHLRAHAFTLQPQDDLLLFFFWDEKQSLFGFFFDGAEQFICPIECLTDVRIENDRGLLIEYKNPNGSLGVFRLTLPIRRLYPYLDGSARNQAEGELISKTLLDKTSEALQRIKEFLVEKAQKTGLPMPPLDLSAFQRNADLGQEDRLLFLEGLKTRKKR